MLRKLLLALLLIPALSSYAILYTYDNLSKSKKTCRIAKWSGTQPTSGKLKLPSTYTHTDGVTYSVTAIKDSALNNLTEVTEITIPASIIQIGEIEEDYLTLPSQANNFWNCPKLVKFITEKDNKFFAVTSDGILLQKLYNGDNMVLSVPGNVAVTKGTLTLGSDINQIMEGAFRDNVSVKTLKLDPNITIQGNGGLNLAKNLAKYELASGNGSLHKIGETLVSGESVVWVKSTPPKTTATEVSLPSTATDIAANAFRGCTSITSVKMPKVAYIGSYAFAGSGITKVTLPSTISQVGSGVFEGCTSLASIKLECKNVDLQKNFAKGCTSLTTVTSSNTIRRIYNAAFLGCTQLSKFPFSATTIMGDSVFYGCGFKEVVYNSDAAVTGIPGRFLFAANPYLEKIDFSQISGTETTAFRIGVGFAMNCPKLKEINFADDSFFLAYTKDPKSPMSGYSSAVERVVFHDFTNTDAMAQFIYSTTLAGGNFKPLCYVAPGKTEKYDWSVKGLFSAGNGATVNPQVITGDSAPYGDYADKNASFYVAGGMTSKYAAAAQLGCSVTEFYGISFTNDGGKLKVTVVQDNRPEIIKPLTNLSISYNGWQAQQMSNGVHVSDKTPSQVSKIRLYYTIDGVDMLTDYDSSYWASTGIEGVTVSDSQREEEYYNLNGVRIDNPGKGIFIKKTADGRFVKVIL